MNVDWKPVLAEVQQLALANDYQCARHFVLDIVDAGAAHRLLAELPRRVRFGDAPERRAPGGSAVSVGFTFAALERLGVDETCLAMLRKHAPGFAAGARARAARRLGDTGPSSPERWPAPFDAERASVLLSVHANTDDVLERACGELSALDTTGAFAGWDKGLDANHLTPFDAAALKPERTAHFGYRDGISRPRIEALPEAAEQTRHPAGELLLGYENDAGFSLWSDRAWEEPTRAFFRNGTFGVFRQMHQDVPAFEAFVAANAAKHRMAVDYVKAKLCGRWPQGQLVTPEDDGKADAPTGAVSNGFTFGAQDAQGYGCPFGSHIRRTNPREDHLAPSRKRPLFRRGIPYGPAYEAGEAKGIERGLMGLFFCASIEDQFETVMSEWVEKMPMGPPSSGDAKDPLVGQNDDPRSSFHIPRPGDTPLQLSGFTPFVRTLGTLYAFFPSREGLARIAAAAAAAAPSSAATAPGKPAAGSGTALPKGAPRRDPPASATGGSDAPLAKDTAPADRFCDIVMEGGVTSGIIYASAIAELARHYRFQSIGGSSIGAFAAALAAAAELRRRNGSIDGFNDVGALPGKLAEEDDGGRTKLFRLFRPQDETRRLFETFCAALGHTSWLARLRHGLAAALRQYRAPVLWAAGGVTVLVLGGPFAHLLLAPGATVAWFWALQSWLLAALLSAAVAGGITLTACVALDLLRMAAGQGGLWRWSRKAGKAGGREGDGDGNGFGLCRGWSRGAELDADEPDLAGYMHLAIQKAAGRRPFDDAPVTFRDLWDAPGSPHALLGVPIVDGEPRSINLEVYATNLNHGRPYRFPIDEAGDGGPLYFRADELAPYFPARVMQHLIGHSVPYAQLDPVRDPPVSEVPEGVRRLPREQLPIVVAARMAMSFPGLISAVPLWAVSREPPNGKALIGQCWLSDGGLCSNFPIHLFDSFVPQWPTFGISLQNAPDGKEPVDPWLPQCHEEGQGDRHDPGTDGHRAAGSRLGAFLFAIWRAAWQWNDMAMLRMPGVRDRVVRVYLKPHQGGINIKMTGADIRELEQLGKKTADAFVQRFAVAGSAGWPEHRWVRLNRLLIALRAAMTGVTVSAGATHGAPSLTQQARAAYGQPPLRQSNGSQVHLNPRQAGEVERLLQALFDLEQRFDTVGDNHPYKATPRPALRTRPPV